MKTCKKCNNEKELTDFYQNKKYKDGFNPTCKRCETERSLSYYKENRDKQLVNKKIRYNKNRDRELEKKREYDKLNKQIINKRARERYQNNKEYAKEYYINNREKILNRNRKWIEDNKEYFNILNSNNTKRWLKQHPHIVAWRQILYRTIYSFNLKKESKTVELLGYSADDLKRHIESLFEIGMTWENWGEWHIDHKYPLSLFDKLTPISVVNALENLRPLWASDNIKKSNKI